MLQDSLTERALHAHLVGCVLSRDASIPRRLADAYVRPLIPEARQWLTRMTLEGLGCRPTYRDEKVNGAMLCDHTVDGCDCGVHVQH